MSDDIIKFPKSKLRILETTATNEERAEANKVVADMFNSLSQRALDGDIADFAITFRSKTKGVESMIGGTVKGFDFMAYLGMLEVLKQRLLYVMSQQGYSYVYETTKKDEKDGPEKPKKT